MTAKGNDRPSDETGATDGESADVAVHADEDEDGYQYPEVVVVVGTEGKGVSSVGDGVSPGTVGAGSGMGQMPRSGTPGVSVRSVAPTVTTRVSNWATLGRPPRPRMGWRRGVVAPTVGGDTAGGTAGEVVWGFIDDKLQRAMVFKSGLETRSLAVISTAGTLVTLLFALTAVVLKDNDRAELSVAERATLVTGTLFLLLAALGGILGNATMRARAVDPRSIRPLLDPEHWGAQRDHALQTLARSQLAVWIDIDGLNRKRMRILRAAITAEALGVAAIAIAAAQILI